MKRTLLIGIVVVGMLFSTGIHITNAQFENLPVIPTSSINLTLNPPTPKPGQRVTAEVSSFSTDLNRATITWFLNGTKVLSGRGETQYNFTAATLGGKQTVLVSVSTYEGTTLEQSQMINPGEVDLIWQAHAYTPPFYKGKAYYSYQGKVTVAAIPNLTGGSINPKNYVYKWRVNGSAYDNVSGYGKDSIEVTGTVIARPLEIEVTASSLDGTAFASNRVTLIPQAPQILLYEESPLYGILYNRALGNFSLKTNEIKLTGVPYNISTSALYAGPISTFAWKINGNSINTSNSNQRSVLLKRPEGQSGQSTLSLNVKNPVQILQFADKTINVTFSSQ